jgi:hypothetical protein
MSKQREALHIALEALEQYGTSSLNNEDAYSAAINAIREALAEPEPWTPDDMAYRPGGLSMSSEMPTRKPLTDDQIDDLELPPNGCTMRELVRAIEHAHGIGEI